MARLEGGAPARTLADIRVNERACIASFLLSSLRELCHRLGIEEGDEVVCRRAAPTVLILRKRGRTIVLERDRARFVLITSRRPAARVDERPAVA